MDYFRHKKSGQILEPIRMNETVGVFYVLDDEFNRIKANATFFNPRLKFEDKKCITPLENVEPLEKKLPKKIYKTLF